VIAFDDGRANRSVMTTFPGMGALLKAAAVVTVIVSGSIAAVQAAWQFSADVEQRTQGRRPPAALVAE
jgi:hypothetical protein